MRTESAWDRRKAGIAPQNCIVCAFEIVNKMSISSQGSYSSVDRSCISGIQNALNNLVFLLNENHFKLSGTTKEHESRKHLVRLRKNTDTIAAYYASLPRMRPSKGSGDSGSDLNPFPPRALGTSRWLTLDLL